MTASVQARLREFTCRLLGRQGAEVDWPVENGEGLALLPTTVAQSLRCMEILPLCFDGAGPLPVNLASEFVERVEPLVAAEPAVACLRVPAAYLKQSDMSEPVARAFTWLNARVRIQETQQTRVEYHTWYFVGTLDSADRWQQIVPVTINAASGTQVAMRDLLDGAAQQVEADDSPSSAPPARTLLAASRAALAHVQRDSGEFLQRLEGRRGRDRKRLQDYYRALLLDGGRRPGRHAAEPDAAEREAKVQAVKLELRRKLSELDERYACKVRLTALALVRLDCPALAVKCQVLRKAAGRTHTLFWNALRKELEPMCCQRCGASTFTVAFSDEQVAALCAACKG
jgi:hypothetical protein